LALIIGTLAIVVALITTGKRCLVPLVGHSMCGVALTWFGYIE